MLMNDKIIFDRYYCIIYIFCRKVRNNGALYFTASLHFHTHKSFRFMLVPGRLQFLIISMCFAWRLVTSKSYVLRTRVRVNCNINA